MPIEIKELVIRAIVDPRDKGADNSPARDGQDRSALVQACVDETLRILRRRGER